MYSVINHAQWHLDIEYNGAQQTCISDRYELEHERNREEALGVRDRTARHTRLRQEG